MVSVVRETVVVIGQNDDKAGHSGNKDIQPAATEGRKVIAFVFSCIKEVEQYAL